MFFSERITIGDSLVITVFSMLLVFAALVVLSFIIDAFKLLANRQDKKTPNTVNSNVAKIEEDKLVSRPVIENTSSDEDELELVAVITASIAAMLSKPASSIVVKNIVRVPQTTPVWGSASRQETIKNNIK